MTLPTVPARDPCSRRVAPLAGAVAGEPATALAMQRAAIPGHPVVARRIVRRYATLVAPEHMDSGPVHAGGVWVGGKEPVQALRSGAAGERHREPAGRPDCGHGSGDPQFGGGVHELIVAGQHVAPGARRRRVMTRFTRKARPFMASLRVGDMAARWLGHRPGVGLAGGIRLSFHNSIVRRSG